MAKSLVPPLPLNCHKQPSIDATGQIHDIPTCFDKFQFKQGQVLQARVSNIYDPSKFWMVAGFRELEAFQTYMFKFYYKSQEQYAIPREKIGVNLYCIVFTEEGFFRGVVVSCCPRTRQRVEEVKVFFIDFGTMAVVTADKLYYMSEKCANVVQFAIRAQLSGICPRGTHTWTAQHVAKFQELVKDKVLHVSIVNIDPGRQLLDVLIGECDDSRKLVDVNSLLVSEGCAQYVHEPREIKPDKSPYEPKVKYLYLFPSHEMLENGSVPFRVDHAEFLLSFVSPLHLYKQYYRRKQSKEDDSE